MNDTSGWAVIVFFILGIVGMAVFYTMCEYKMGMFKHDA